MIVTKGLGGNQLVTRGYGAGAIDIIIGAIYGRIRAAVKYIQAAVTVQER